MLHRIFLVCLTGLTLQACAGKESYIKIGSAEHRALVGAHLDILSPAAGGDGGGAQEITLTLGQALERAAAYNLDARVSALEVLAQDNSVSLEKLQALPSVTLSGGLQGRSNEGASSSQSVLTGTQSLEPSISTDQYRRAGDLSINWNLLDAALTVLQSKTAEDRFEIALQRHEKVLENIQRDVYAAYWYAQIQQNKTADTARLTQRVKEQLRQIEQANRQGLFSKAQSATQSAPLIEKLQQLQALDNALSPAMVELKSLLSLPLDSKLVLISPASDFEIHPEAFLKRDMEELEYQALLNRPEMRESIIEKNIALRDTKAEIYRSFPGAKIFFAHNKDSNGFLQDNEWMSFSGTLVQNIAALFTLPVRYRAGKNNEALQDQKNLALSAAVLAQVHLARHRLDYLNTLHGDLKTSSKMLDFTAATAMKKKNEGLASAYEATIAAIDAHIARTRTEQAFADLQDAYAAMQNTLGQNTLRQKTPDSPPTIKSAKENQDA